MISSTAPSPSPPYSSSIAMPGQPSSQIASQLVVEYGVSPSASSRTRSGLKRLERNSRAVDLISRCSSVKSKSMATCSFGRERTRSATMFFRTSVVPPSIELARERRKRYAQSESLASISGPPMSIAELGHAPGCVEDH